MARQTKQERERDKLISDSYRIFGCGVQIKVLDLPRIFEAGRDALEHGLDLDAAVQNAITKYRQN